MSDGFARVMQGEAARLLAREEALMRDMARRWAQMESRLADDFEALAYELAEAQKAGMGVNEAAVLRMERTQKLLYAARAELADYTNWVSDEIAAEQRQAARQGLKDAVMALKTIAGAGAGISFNILPVYAVDALIGMVGDGTPLLSWLKRVVSPEAVQGMIQALVDGIVIGLNPKKVALMMVKQFGVGLQRAMNCARTETLRAYRQASLKQYQESGVVVGYKRLSKRDARVCIGCLFTDGMVVEDLDHFDEHNQGRCTLIPIVRGAEDASNFETGMEWFLKQSDEKQREILGPLRYSAWKNGTALEDMVKHVEDPIWGGSWVPAPVKLVE